MKKVGDYKMVKIIGISLFALLIIAVFYVFNIKKMPTIYNELDEVQTLDDNIVVEITLPKELIESDVLEVYEYSTSGISKIEININSSTINFEVSTLNADFLIVGMRETYSKGDNWKIGMIFIFIFVFLGSLYLIKKVNKKNKFK